MKIYEKINELKGTDATCEIIKNWMYMNRITPCALQDGLELDCEYPNQMDDLAMKLCNDTEMDCYECLNRFLDSEFHEEKE